MDIYILRHGIAEDVSRTGRDRDRELTPEGIDKTRAAGKALRKLGIAFDAILASPYPRAWATAEIVSDELKLAARLHQCAALASGEPAHGVLAELRQAARKHQTVLLVGHEPDLSQLISILLSGAPRLAIAMKKGGLCKLSCDAPEPGRAILHWLLTAKLLERMA